MSCYDWNSTEWYESPPAPPLTPGSTDADHEQTNAQWVVLGVVLCEVAVVMIALGSDLQRYALTMVVPERRCGPFSCSNGILEFQDNFWHDGLIENETQAGVVWQQQPSVIVDADTNFYACACNNTCCNVNSSSGSVSCKPAGRCLAQSV